MRAQRQLLAYLILVGGLWWLGGCGPRSSAPRFSPQDVLVDLSVFPAGWFVAIPPGPVRERLGQVEGARVQFLADDPRLIGARHLVLRYQGEWVAAWRYEQLQRSWFNSNSILSVTPWRVPGQLPYRSPVADKSRFACHESDVAGLATICEFMGLYGEYVVIFHTVMTPEDMQPRSYMTFQDLARILRAIDEKMAVHLRR